MGLTMRSCPKYRKRGIERVRRNILLQTFLLVVVFIAHGMAQNDQRDVTPYPPVGASPITNLPREQQQERDRPNPDKRPLQEQTKEDKNSLERVALPESDIEFQDFVASSTGHRLPIFGMNLFQNVPTTFAPLEQVPVVPDYLIGPGDELLVRAWGAIDINYQVVVDRTGMINLPK